MTIDPKLESVETARVARLGARMQLGVNGARRSAAVESGTNVPSTPKRMQFGISGARRARFETRVALAVETHAPVAPVELGIERAPIALPVEVQSSSVERACAATDVQRTPKATSIDVVELGCTSITATELGTCPP